MSFRRDGVVKSIKGKSADLFLKLKFTVHYDYHLVVHSLPNVLYTHFIA